jgi:hypothetical protein
MRPPPRRRSTRSRVPAISGCPTIRRSLATANAKDGVVQGLNVTGLHLCCKMCVKDFNRAVSVTGTDAAKDAESVQITGSFNAKDVIAALNAAGFSAQMQ